MEFDIETWVPYRCDFKPISTNSLFSDSLGRIAEMAMRMESEFLYMETGDACPVGTLVPENLIRPHMPSSSTNNFAMVFSYSPSMEKILFRLVGEVDHFGVGITLCGIWKHTILVEECKVLLVASASPLFDPEFFLASLDDALSREEAGGAAGGANIPYFAEKLGFRRFQIPYETDDVTDLRIANVLSAFEFDETRIFVGPQPEMSLDNF